MYLCKKCGNMFDVPERHIEIDPDMGCAQYRTGVARLECPLCNSEYFEEAALCIGCGNLVYEKNVIRGYCPDCIRLLARYASNILKREMTKDFYNAIREYLELPEGDDGEPDL